MYQISSHDVLNTLISKIEQPVANAKEKLATSVNKTITETYWQIGKYIVETEQNGNIKAEYGKKLLTTLSHELTLRLGKGFTFICIWDISLWKRICRMIMPRSVLS